MCVRLCVCVCVCVCVYVYMCVCAPLNSTPSCIQWLTFASRDSLTMCDMTHPYVKIFEAPVWCPANSHPRVRACARACLCAFACACVCVCVCVCACVCVWERESERGRVWVGVGVDPLTCDMTPSPVTWLIHMWQKLIYTRKDSFTCDTTTSHISHGYSQQKKTPKKTPLTITLMEWLRFVGSLKL